MNDNNMKYDAGTDPSQPLGLKRPGTALDADVPGKGQRIGGTLQPVAGPLSFSTIAAVQVFRATAGVRA